MLTTRWWARGHYPEKTEKSWTRSRANVDNKVMCSKLLTSEVREVMNEVTGECWQRGHEFEVTNEKRKRGHECEWRVMSRTREREKKPRSWAEEVSEVISKVISKVFRIIRQQGEGVRDSPPLLSPTKICHFTELGRLATEGGGGES